VKLHVDVVDSNKNIEEVSQPKNGSKTRMNGISEREQLSLLILVIFVNVRN
jgi:hypothetical protein